jgi:hypothetical protein
MCTSASALHTLTGETALHKHGDQTAVLHVDNRFHVRTNQLIFKHSDDFWLGRAVHAQFGARTLFH